MWSLLIVVVVLLVFFFIVCMLCFVNCVLFCDDDVHLSLCVFVFYLLVCLGFCFFLIIG